MRTHSYDQRVKAIEIGQVIPVVAAHAPMHLRVFRASGPVDIHPHTSTAAAKIEGRRLYLEDDDVYRVDLRDPMRNSDIWSTDEETGVTTRPRA